MRVSIEELLKNTKSYYRLVLLAAQRTNALAEGAPPLIMTKSKKPAVVALEEIVKKKIYCEEGKDTKAKKS